ncbi:MAG TPA: response regulator [Vicinamibacterales bacterium]|nr:response regulator [Vicinamibacterales bacterium]
MTSLQFGRYTLDAREYRLMRDGQPVALPPKPFDLLVALATRPGQLVTRDELLREVWKDVVVEQSSLNAAMSVLRQALGEDAASILETVPGRGYRFVAQSSPVLPAPPASPASVRVMIVDDHAVVRLGVRSLVERTPGFAVVGEADSLEDAGPLIHAAQPDLLVLDMMLGDVSSLGSIKAWRASAPGLRVIVLSMHDEDGHAREALSAGAHGYVMKAGMAGELSTAIAAVAAGDVWVSAKLSQAILREFADVASR